jgi:hypothetical protein
MENVDMAPVAAAGGVALGILIVELVIALLMIISMWKVFAKAGQPGWASIVPIYNAVVILQIAGKPVWWIILFLVPIANLIVGILTLAGLAKAFGRGAGTVVGLILLPIIFWPILGFGSAEYQGAGEQA